ncbi:MAG: hypothetical protein R3A46_01445 [Thermomicrobiales bacterium]
MDVPTRSPGHGKKISHYGFGRTIFFASQYDQRCSYCLYVPHDYDEDGDQRYPLVVIVHGTGRTASQYRDAFAAFAEREQCIVLAPLFPAGIIEPGEISSYKYIKFHDMRFDLILLAMIDEIGETYRIDAERFLLQGFSGGGHFTHRFFYLHPQRLMAASIGAPGMVTLLDVSKPWWVGVGNLKEELGIDLDIDAMRRVPVQMIVGGDDVETWEITIPEDGRWWMPGVNDSGRTRIDRLTSLRESFERHDIDVRFEIVPGVAHVGLSVVPLVEKFFSEVLAERRQDIG